MGSSYSKYHPDTDIPDLTGKVALVAGGNAGIGFETVKELVRHGAHVYLGARNESRATGALAKLKAEGVLGAPGAGKVEWLPLDVATPSTTKMGAEEFLRRATRLDILGRHAGLSLLTAPPLTPLSLCPLSEQCCVVSVSTPGHPARLRIELNHYLSQDDRNRHG